MARGVNKVILIGNATEDAELKVIGEGRTVCNFTVATNDSYTDKSTGEVKEVAQFHRCVAFSRLADVCGQYIKKGQQVYIEGALKHRKHEDRYYTNIEVHEMKLLGRETRGDAAAPQGQRRSSNRPDDSGRRGAAASVPGGKGYGGSDEDGFDDQIPF